MQKLLLMKMLLIVMNELIQMTITEIVDDDTFGRYLFYRDPITGFNILTI